MKILKLSNLIIELPDELTDVDDCEYSEFFVVKIDRYSNKGKIEPNYIHDVYIEDFLDETNYL